MTVATTDLARAFEEVDAIYRERGNVNVLMKQLGLDPKELKAVGGMYGLTQVPNLLLKLTPRLDEARNLNQIIDVLLDELPGVLGIAFLSGVVSQEKARNV